MIGRFTRISFSFFLRSKNKKTWVKNVFVSNFSSWVGSTMKNPSLMKNDLIFGGITKKNPQLQLCLKLARGYKEIKYYILCFGFVTTLILKRIIIITLFIHNYCQGLDNAITFLIWYEIKRIEIKSKAKSKST